MGGIKALAVDVAILFLLYGTKKIRLTPEEIVAVRRYAARRNTSGGTRAEVALAFRSEQLKTMGGLKRYEALPKDKAFSKAYLAKTWLR